MPKDKTIKETYLGDGVYMKWDGNRFTLYTSYNGNEVTNNIVLEIETWLALTRFVKSLENESTIV
jgi:hypothetical protein